MFNADAPLELVHATQYIYTRSAAKVGGSGTKIHKKVREISESASLLQQDMIYSGLSGSRGRPAWGSGCFLQTLASKQPGQALNP